MATRPSDHLPAPMKAPVTGQHSPGRLPTWTAVLLGGLSLTAALQVTVTLTANPTLIPALILFGSVVVPATLLAFLTGHRSDFTLHPAQVATIAAVGGVLGLVLSALAEHTVRSVPGMATPTGVAVIEEAVKLLVPLLVLVRTRQPRAADGLLVGVATGAGFGVLETMGYASVIYVQSHYDLAIADTVLLARSLLSPAAHIAWTGLLTVALWSAARHRWTPAALARLGAAIALVLALHTAWDSARDTAGYLVTAVIGLALLVTVTHHVTRHRGAAG
jgi:RsiW-degrading membrane proteinase PrsW (M82 family)